MFVVGRGVDDDIDHGRAVFRKCREQSRPQFFKRFDAPPVTKLRTLSVMLDAGTISGVEGLDIGDFGAGVGSRRRTL